jgi:radical SAM-linked protein
MPNGQILPKEDAPKIRKRVVDTLDGAKFPTKYIVPYTEQVHDRLSLEVLRGCTQGCRFCQAGMVTRPVRERSLENIDTLMKEALENTGYEEVSLVSLSTCDFSRPRSLVEQAANQNHMEHTSISLPSLRLDSFAVEMADRVSDVRRSGLTFAPEAASPRLRQVINKWIPDEELLNMSAEAFKRGWKHVKCYFMIGLPTERDEDIEAIIDLCERTVEKGRTINHAAKVNLGVSTFVPKPFTPFQWAAQIDMDETERRQKILDEGFRKNRNIKFGRHTAETTFIEGLVTRADRRGADLIEAAWKRGARFESWDEFCDIKAWLQAVEDVNYDVEFELGERDIYDRLPWDHIDVLMPKDWFQEDWNRAMEYKYAEDCRAGKCHMCGVIFKEQELCSHMLRNQRKGRIEEKEWEPAPRPTYVEPESIQRIRLKIGWHGEVRFLGHLERQNVWIRALRRAHVPLSYSQGFHAHPKMNFAMASPVGEECECEYLDIHLKETTDPAMIKSRLNDVLPQGFTVYDASEVAKKLPSLSSVISGIDYSIVVPNEDAKAIRERIEQFLSTDECIVQRKVKQRKKGRKRGPNNSPKTVDFNVRPYIDRLELETTETESGTITLVNFHTIQLEQKMGKPKEIMELLEISPHQAWVIKRDIQIRNTPEPVDEINKELEPAGV